MSRVSIVIPVYNGANFLGEAVRSALAQTYRNFEVIVVNDGSQDAGETARVASAFGGGVRYFEKPHGGIASALNFGIEKMEGELFSWLSHDDIYMPEKLVREVSALEAAGSGAIVYSDFFAIDNRGRLLRSYRLPDVPAAGVRCFLAESSALHGCTLLIPRTFLQENRFNEALRITQDYDLWFRLASRYPFIHVAEQLVGVRFHAGQTTARSGAAMVAERDRLYVGFMNELKDAEIAAYAGNDTAEYYLKLYRHFAAGKLKAAAALARGKYLAAGGGQGRLAVAEWAEVPLAGARALARWAVSRL